MNARHPIGIAATSPRAIAAAAELFTDRALDKLTGKEALSELTFLQLLDLQDEASEDETFDTFNDVSRELKNRRDDAKAALKRLFVDRCDNGGSLPMVVGQKLVQVDIAEIVRETMGTNWGTELGAELVLHSHARASVIARMAAQFVEDCCEDNLRAGWAAEVSHG